MAAPGKPVAKRAGAFDVHVFLATGEATVASGADYRKGERYSLLIFCRQSIGEKPNRDLGGKSAAAAGWKDVTLERSKRLPSGAAPADPVLREAFGEALAEGSAVVAYKEPVKILST